MANGITVLTREWAGLYGRHPWLKPRPVLLGNVNEAAKMRTTLWFDQKIGSGRWWMWARRASASCCSST